jgi:hypothetical protein
MTRALEMGRKGTRECQTIGFLQGRRSMDRTDGYRGTPETAGRDARRDDSPVSLGGDSGRMQIIFLFFD